MYVLRSFAAISMAGVFGYHSRDVMTPLKMYLGTRNIPM